MSITTTSIMNPDQFQAALVAQAPGAAFSANGDFTQPGTKTITGFGATDAQLQAAVTTAAAQFVDYGATKAQILTNLQNHLASLKSWAAANPTGAVLTAGQTLFVANTLIGLCYLMLEQFTTTAGT